MIDKHKKGTCGDSSSVEFHGNYVVSMDVIAIWKSQPVAEIKPRETLWSGQEVKIAVTVALWQCGPHQNSDPRKSGLKFTRCCTKQVPRVSRLVAFLMLLRCCLPKCPRNWQLQQEANYSDRSLCRSFRTRHTRKRQAITCWKPRCSLPLLWPRWV